MYDQICLIFCKNIKIYVYVLDFSEISKKLRYTISSTKQNKYRDIQAQSLKK